MFRRIPDLVSIVVPVFNTVTYLPECLDSLVNQTYPDIEMILVDDCSSDGCEAFIERWRSEMSDKLNRDRIVHVRLPRNTKQPGSATTALFLARGEFIACQASDDFSHVERIAKQVDFLRSHPEVDLVGTNYATFEDGKLDEASMDYSSWLRFGREQIKRNYAMGHHCICDGTIVMRGEAFDRIGGWTRRLTSASDFEFVGRYVSNGMIAENLTDVLYYYRLHQGQTTQRLARGEVW